MGPTGKRWLTAMGMVGVLLAAVHACNPRLNPGPPRSTVAPAVSHAQHQRYAESVGSVTVDVTVFGGPVPDTNMTGGSVTVAEFSNVGEGGKKEKRYKWRPRGAANYKYELVLSADPKAKRTRWDMVEVNQVTRARVSYKSGHLWSCDPRDHPASGRAANFKACALPVEYDPSELAGIPQGASVRFASYLRNEDAESLQSDTPVWISCNSGCCSLGRSVEAN